jgi:hypothetical protein
MKISPSMRPAGVTSRVAHVEHHKHHSRYMNGSNIPYLNPSIARAEVETDELISPSKSALYECRVRGGPQLGFATTCERAAVMVSVCEV